jgi:putative oxidoreductase
MQTVDTHELITPSPAVFAGTDGFAIRSGDAFVLVGRVLIGWLFFISGWAKLGNIAGFAAYLTNLKVPGASFWAWPGAIAEFLIGIALILGIASRYAALFTFVYLIIATALAHRYWEYPAAQQFAQYNNFLKNLSIMGASLFLFVTGAGRFSVDGWLRRSGR